MSFRMLDNWTRDDDQGGGGSTWIELFPELFGAARGFLM